MPLRYRVTGFVTYHDDAGRRAAIPAGELVEIARACDGSGSLIWRDPAGRIRTEALSDRLLAHYTQFHLEPAEPAMTTRGRPAARYPRYPMRAFR